MSISPLLDECGMEDSDVGVDATVSCAFAAFDDNTTRNRLLLRVCCIKAARCC
jgi:hypothetical protein